MIETNTNNSNICLYDCKELVRECVTKSCLEIDCDEILNALTCEIDIDKFQSWLNRNINTFKTKQNIQTYFKRAFITELHKGTFNIEKIVVDTTSLVKAMRDKGIKVTKDDPLYLEIMWEEIIKACIKEDVATNLNHSVIDYMNEGDDFQMYLYYIKHSNGLRGLTIDWDKIDTLYKQELAKWTIMLNDLSLEALPND